MTVTKLPQVRGLLSSVSQLHSFLSSTPRRRSRVDCHWKLTQAYLDLMMAWAFAQTGDAERSAELFRQGASALPRWDVVHQTLLQAFASRMSERPDASPWTRLQLDVSHLEPFEQYKVCRVLDTVSMLSRVERWDATTRFFNAHKGLSNQAHDDLVTRILVADGEGQPLAERQALLRALFSAEPLHTRSGAALLGPARRAGVDAEHLAHLIRAHAASGIAPLAAALCVRGQGAPHEPPPGSAALWVRLTTSRLMIGSLSLAGGHGEAELAAARLWQEATDHFNTNTHYSLTALAVCDLLIMSTLRHELALGNRFHLEPDLAPPASAATSQRANDEDAEQEAEEEVEPGLAQFLATIQKCLEIASELAVPELKQLLHDEAHRFAEFDSGPAAEPNGFDDMTPRALAEWVLSSIDDAASALDEGLPATIRGEPSVRIRLKSAQTLIQQFKRQARRAEARKRLISCAMRSIGSCLQSCVVEKPELPAPLAHRIKDFTQRHCRGWNEAPYEELVAQLTTRLAYARRSVSAAQTEPFSGQLTELMEDVNEAEALIGAVITFSRS
jgi:hypothetical protein